MTHWSDYFRNLGACEKALVEARKYPTWQEFWDACEHPDWLLWDWARLNPDNNFYLACCDIAEWSLSFYEDVYEGDDRPRKAVEARRAFLRGEITAAELKIAAKSAGSTAGIAAEIARNACSAARIAAESAGRIAAESTVSKNLADIIRNRQPKAPALP